MFSSYKFVIPRVNIVYCLIPHPEIIPRSRFVQPTSWTSVCIHNQLRVSPCRTRHCQATTYS